MTDGQIGRLVPYLRRTSDIGRRTARCHHGHARRGECRYTSVKHAPRHAATIFPQVKDSGVHIPPATHLAVGVSPKQAATDADGGHDRSLEVMAGRALQPTATNDPLSR